MPAFYSLALTGVVGTGPRSDKNCKRGLQMKASAKLLSRDMPGRRCFGTIIAARVCSSCRLYLRTVPIRYSKQWHAAEPSSPPVRTECRR